MITLVLIPTTKPRNICEGFRIQYETCGKMTFFKYWPYPKFKGTPKQEPRNRLADGKIASKRACFDFSQEE
jgi:hypothetical protein